VGERVALRPVSSTDAHHLVRLWTDPEVRRYLGGAMSPDAARQQASVAVERRQMLVAHPFGSTDHFVGAIGVDRRRAPDLQVSYAFQREHWGHGYAVEAVSLVVDWLLEHLGAKRIIAVTQTANSRSRRLLDAVGMHVEAEFIEFDAAQTLYALERSQTGNG
jgi:RimJ/RimL family protein N-acetyltransferase